MNITWSIIVLALAGVAGYFLLQNEAPQAQPLITSFEECAAAGYPIMESYPEQCMTSDGKTFVRQIEETELPPNSSGNSSNSGGNLGAPPNTPQNNNEPVFCTMDAMMCPDGSYVGRTGPNCEFVCPASR